MESCENNAHIQRCDLCLVRTSVRLKLARTEGKKDEERGLTNAIFRVKKSGERTYKDEVKKNYGVMNSQKKKRKKNLRFGRRREM